MTCCLCAGDLIKIKINDKINWFCGSWVFEVEWIDGGCVVCWWWLISKKEESEWKLWMIKWF